MKLYELTGAFNQVAEMLEYDSENETIIDTLESIDLAIEEKANGYAKLIRNQEAESKAFGEEIKRMKERKQAVDNNVKRMKLSLQNAMVEIGKTKFKTDLFSFRVQNNPFSLNIESTENIPEKYFIPQPAKPDTKLIKDDLKAGVDIPGAHLTQTRGVRIS